MINVETQFELMYSDVVSVTADTKRMLYDLTKWVVALNTAVVGISLSNDFSVPYQFSFLPLGIGALALLVNRGLQSELNEHRETLANLRNRIGSPMKDIYAKHINTHLHPGGGSLVNYWNIIKSGHLMIILISSIGAYLTCRYAGL